MAGVIAAVGVAGIAANVVMAKQGADAAKKAGRKVQSQAEQDRIAAEKAQRRQMVAQENESLFQQAQSQLAQAGPAGANTQSGISPQIIVPVALGTVAVALTVILIARRKR